MHSINYSKACGQIIAYQVGSTGAFSRPGSSPTIDNSYVDGISLTHGNPRQHIWTFAAGFNEQVQLYTCPVLDVLESDLHPLWELTIFVKLVTITTIHHSLCDSIPTLCGMELVVGLRAHAVPSIPLHGSTSNCHNPPLMTLRWGCARMSQEILKI
jgi:hypothetical protein